MERCWRGKGWEMDMKQVGKRLGAAVLAAAMLAALGGCKTDQGEKNAAKTTLRVEVFDRGASFENGNTIENNDITRWVNETFGEPNNIDVVWVPIQRAQEVEKLNVLLAAKEAPDIVFTYDRDVFYNYAKQGGLTQLDDLLAKHGSNLLKNMESVSQNGLYQGKRYAIVNGGDLARDGYQFKAGQFMSYIRKDWLDKLSLPVPTNADELYEVLKAFREKDPGNVGRDMVIPMGLAATSLSDEDWQQNTLYLTEAFLEPMTEEEFYTLPYLKKPGFKEGVRFLNKLYNEKLIDQDFALQNDWTQFWQNVSNGRVGFYTHNLNTNISPKMAYGSLVANVPGAELIAIEPFANKEGKNPKRTVTTGEPYIMIPSFSKCAEAAVKYLEFCVQPENGTILRYGFEGVHYTVENGMRVENKEKPLTWPGDDFSLPITNWGYPDLDKELDSYMIGFEEPYASVRRAGVELAMHDVYEAPRFTEPILSESKYVATLDKKFQETMIKSIVAAPDAFDQTYDALTEEYMRIGGEEIRKEKQEAFRSGKAAK